MRYLLPCPAGTQKKAVGTTVSEVFPQSSAPFKVNGGLEPSLAQDLECHNRRNYVASMQ